MRVLIPLLLALGLAACGDPETVSSQPDDMAHDMMAQQASDAAAAAGDTQPLPRDDVDPVIEVAAAWLRPHPQGRDVTAAYIVTRLTEGRADRMLGAEIQGASHVEMHGHAMGENGMMRMRAIGPQRLTDDGPLVFTPGGRHLMVFGLEPVRDGDTVEGWLIFERAGRLPVTFEVRAAPPGGPAAD